MKKATRKNNQVRKKQVLPPRWNEERVQAVLEHYENQTEDEAVAEHEAAFSAEGQTVMVLPTELVPKVRALLARWYRASQKRGASGKAR
jgi:hypothetical protein